VDKDLPETASASGLGEGWGKKKLVLARPTSLSLPPRGKTLLALDLKKSLERYTSGGASFPGILMAFLIMDTSWTSWECLFSAYRCVLRNSKWKLEWVSPILPISAWREEYPGRGAVGWRRSRRGLRGGGGTSGCFCVASQAEFDDLVVLAEEFLEQRPRRAVQLQVQFEQLLLLRSEFVTQAPLLHPLQSKIE
jgi:hypothetical protein